MTKLENLGETHDATITVLVDNHADLLVRSSESVKRFTDEPLLAEHGFSALIQLPDATILWDAGISETALLENMKRLKLDPARIDTIAISHGHSDHTGALLNLLLATGRAPASRKWGKKVDLQEVDDWIQSRRIPLVVHPAAFRERWAIDRQGAYHGPNPPPSRAAWEAAGARVVLAEGPTCLAMGCWTTGQVPRRTFETAGVGSRRLYRADGGFRPDLIEDDQAIFMSVRDKGLVILAGCAHSGILNTINQAREISGIDQVWAVLGGFHLAPASDADIARTIDAIQALEPVMVVPTHCTGFAAISEFVRRMPEAFVLGAVGTKYLF
jgi:7,8-dihydropterin-6-yl-methyl-4-(beta-D-ribofuranosyl)aminobenzene 5'-phosphate synthase